jgi:hypothetical protein
MRRLIVFSDPGGAKPCLAIAKKWQETHEVLVCSNRFYSFYESFGMAVRDCTSDNAEEIFDEFQPCSLYTGTSYTSSFELDFIRHAETRKIKSTSFVDHYTGFDTRFGPMTNRVLPDEIHVIDKEAADLAQAAGLPLQRIRIVGNPYHDFLREWQPRYKKQELFKKIGVPISDATTILFAPDPVSNAGGRAKFGTDETEILSILLQALNTVGKPFQLLIKPHPNQSRRKLTNALSFHSSNIQCNILSNEADSLLNEVIWYSDYVCGMFSNLLVEAEVMGKCIFRVYIGFTQPDPLSARLAFNKFTSFAELANFINALK